MMTMKKLIEPRWELEKYEGKRISIIGRYERYENHRQLIMDVTILETGEKLHHMNIKTFKYLKHDRFYKITGTIIRYKSDTKTTGYDFGFDIIDLEIEGI